jgi:hypothetical protein
MSCCVDEDECRANQARIAELEKDRVQLIEQAARDTFASNARIAELEAALREIRDFETPGPAASWRYWTT